MPQQPTARQLTASTNTQRYNAITWIDIGRPTSADMDRLANEYSFHPLHLEAALLTGHLPQIELEENYLFLLLQIPGFNAKENAITTDQVAIFLGSDYLITIHKEQTDQIKRLFMACQKDETLRGTYFKDSSGYLLYKVLDGLLKDAAELIQSILADLDEVESLVFEDRVSAPYKIGQLRQRITRLKRLMDFLKNLLGELTTGINEFTGQNLAVYYKSIAKQVHKLAAALEEANETVTIFKDADFTASTEKTNRVLEVLTIIFTLTIPATIIGSFYGMNVPVPGGIVTGTWTFLGTYTTLIVIVLISLIAAILMSWYFKKKKWY